VSDATSRDVVTIGSGIAALTAAALLARSGRKVLVLEQHKAPGGYAHAFHRTSERGTYVFDPAVHLLADPPLWQGILDFLGVSERCRLIPEGRFYRVMLPSLTLDLPAGREAFVEAHVGAFPACAEGIRRFWSLCETVHREAHDLPPTLSLAGLDGLSAQAPNLLRYRNATLADVLDEHISDPHARSLCAAAWHYLGLPPSQASFLTFAQLTTVHTTTGVVAVEGGVQRIADALVSSIERDGGEVRTGTLVSEVVLRNGRAVGVRAGGEEIPAQVVLSNADTFQTFGSLVPESALPAEYLKRYRRLVPSGSGFCVFTATGADLARHDPPAQIFTFDGWDHEEAHRRTQSGDFAIRWISPASVLDPSLAPPGEHVITSVVTVPYDIGRPWPEVIDGCRDRVLQAIEEALPGVGDKLRFVEVATPPTFERFSLNRRGAIHSWEQTVRQTESKRPPQSTPIEGLYLCSQWTNIGGGFLRAFVCGVSTAKMLLARDGDKDAIPDFRSVPVPPSRLPRGDAVVPARVRTGGEMDNVAKIRRLIEEVWEQGKVDVADEILAPDIVNHDLMPGAQDGLEGFKHHVVDLRGGSSDLHLKVEFLVGAGEWVTARWRWQGIHDGPIFGIPASLRRLDVPQLAVWRFENGKAKDFWQRSDETGMLIQMGVIPERDVNPLYRVLFMSAGTLRMAYRQMRYQFRRRRNG
jgi:prolycopene isomerase